MRDPLDGKTLREKEELGTEAAAMRAGRLGDWGSEYRVIGRR
jgi:hypothetical protein